MNRRLRDPKEPGAKEFPFRYVPACATDVRATIARAQGKQAQPASAQAKRILDDIRLLRNAYQTGEIRSALNEAADRMDVAFCKISNESEWSNG